MKKLVLVSTALFFLLSISAIFAYSLNPSLDITYPIKKLAVWVLNLFGINTELIEPMVGGCPVGQICCSDTSDCSGSGCLSGTSQGQCSSVYRIYSCSNCATPSTSPTSTTRPTTSTSTSTISTTTTIPNCCCCDTTPLCSDNCMWGPCPYNGNQCSPGSYTAPQTDCNTPCTTSTITTTSTSTSTTRPTTTSTSTSTSTTTTVPNCCCCDTTPLCSDNCMWGPCPYNGNKCNPGYITAPQTDCNTPCTTSTITTTSTSISTTSTATTTSTTTTQFCCCGEPDYTCCIGNCWTQTSSCNSMNSKQSNMACCLSTPCPTSTTTTIYKVPSSTTTSSSTTTIVTTSSTTTTVSCPQLYCDYLLSMIKGNYNSKCGSSNYDPTADVNKDGKVDLSDFTMVSSYCGSDGLWCMNRIVDNTDPCTGSTTTTTIYKVPSSTTTSSTTTSSSTTTIVTTSSTTTTVSCPQLYCDYLLSMIKGNYNSKCGSSNYDPTADVNKDGKVDLSDFTMVSSYCGSDGLWCMNRIVDNTDPCVIQNIKPSSTTTISSTTTTIICVQSCLDLLDRAKGGYGSKCGSSNYDPTADVNKDGKVDLSDFTMVSSYCGNENWCQSKLNDLTDPCVIQNIKPSSTTTISSTTTTIICVQSCLDLLDRAKGGYGSKCGSSNYDPAADVNKDGKVDLSDLTSVNSYCGNENWCQSKLNDLTDPCMVCSPASCEDLLDRLNAAYGSDCNSGNYDPVGDVNKDKSINLNDLKTVSSHCGDGSWCENQLSSISNPCTSMTELVGKCLNTCSKNYPLLWCRFSCNFACVIGFC